MSNLLARLLLALVLLVATPVVYVVTFLLGDQTRYLNDTAALFVADIVTGAGIVAAWIMIWRPQVVWTTERRRRTGLVALVAIAPAMAIGFLIVAVRRYDDEIAMVMGGLTWATCWLAGTILVWRETPHERSKRLGELSSSAIACPQCGYNMTGLHHARCPECGTQYTLDELFATLREKAADLESEQEQEGRRAGSPANDS